MVRRGSTVRVRQRASASPCLDRAFVFRRDAGQLFWRPPGVHQRPRFELGRVQCIEEVDCMLASVAGEMAVVAVDYPQTGSPVARKGEGGGGGTKSKKPESV